MDSNATPAINREVQFGIDGYEGTDKVFETHLKDLVLTTMEKGDFDTRGILSETFECSTKILKEKMEGLGRVYSSGPGSYFVIEPTFLLRADVLRDEGPLRFRVWVLSTKDMVQPILNRVRESLREFIYTKMGLDVSWAFAKQGKIDYIDVQSELDEIVYPEAYPYIPDMDKWVARYLDSKSMVLLLIGNPGTGKTRLIKHILKTIGLRKTAALDAELVREGGGFDTRIIKNPYILYSMDDKVFGDDSFFIKFFSDHFDALVLEDIDLNLKSRKVGNSFMAKLLGGSDGVVSGTRRKLILSTNLKNITDIDEALTRPGRCFGIVSTRELDLAEAEVLAKVLEKDITALKTPEKQVFSLAEIYNL